MSTSKVLKGTALLSGATMISRILGFIYFFPFQLLVGTQGVALYGYAYSWYGILLSFSTAGIPIAVSKFVAKHNALGDYSTSKKLYNSSVKLMLFMGFLGFLILFIGAPYISQFIIRSKTPDPQFIADVTLTMRALSFALIIVPAMSVTRGYFQGFQHMKPSAVSQVVEQIARVVFILVGSFIVSKLLGGSVASSVAVATFGAVIGALASVSILKKYNRLKPPEGELKSRASNIPLKNIYMELLRYAIPIVFVGIAIPLYTLVDQYTVADVLRAMGEPLETANAVFAYITNYAQKLIMIPASLATGFSLTIIPAITKSYTSGKLEELQEQISKIFQVLLFFTIPAAFGLASIAYDAFRMVYVNPEIALGGSQYLISFAPSAILSAIFTVSAAILQGIDYQRKTMIAFSAGILVKVVVNTPLLHLFGGHGAVLGTILGYLVSNIIMLYCIVKFAKFKIDETAKTVFLITIYSAAMSAVVMALKVILTWLIPGQSYIESLLIVVICGAAGGIVYLLFVLTSGLASHILGDKIQQLPVLGKLIK
ncbi:polysaccharide biosynthesis protein [Bacillus tropicus]|uniref:putative polysaccharide biosynthesis protein n=1 Tax=Bacillus tropicus TaxID=2026188 RepID=UPI000937C4FF|nr:polysaccharide biosynthesis protein [Bacillus tropicus]MED3382805.1 polysaccharide biosynthesis protein [Bacillus tropicus]